LCSGRYRSLASAFSVLALRTASYRVDRNLVRELPSAPAWPLVAPSWLARVSQPVAPDSQAAHSSAVLVVRQRWQVEPQVLTVPED